jgi:hypothetical protein
VWEYRPLPEGLRLPPCPRCTNRGRVSQFARFAYYCGDCEHAFAAIWHEEPKQVRSRSIESLESIKTGDRMATR